MPASSRFSLEAILSLTDDMTKPYKRTTNKITGLNDRLGRSFQTLNRGITRGLKIAAGVGLAAIGAGLVAATREFIKLDDSITQAGAKFKDLDTTSETYKDTLKELSTAAREVGKVTEFSAVDAAGALDKFAMAGFRSDQAMALLAGTTDLATAANTDLTTAVDIATDTLGAFGLVVDDTAQLQENLARVSNVMAKTTTTANTSLEEMFEAVGAGAAVFTSAGQEMETFAAFTGILANSTLKGGAAGTSLRNVMLRLSKPTSEASDVLKELGVQTADSEGNFRDAIDILADFEKGLKGMGSQQRTAALATVFGARTVTGINLLLAEGTENLREYREELKDSGTAAVDMATAMRQSLGNRLKVLKSGLTELGLQFIESFEVDGRNALDSLIEGVQNFDMQPIIDGTRKAVDAFKELKPTLDAIIESIKLLGGLVDPITKFLNFTSENNLIKALQGDAPIFEAFKDKFIGAGRSSREAVTEFRSGQAAVTAEDPRLNIGGSSAVEEQRIKEETIQRQEINITAPSGFGLQLDPGVAPTSSVNLGEQ